MFCLILYIEIGANTERLCKYKSKYNPKLLISFSSKKYISHMSKIIETIYVKLFKKINISKDGIN
jgi:hypothetical protein